jgi:hypothetical protein
VTHLSRSPILYPKHLNLYAQCPERYFHERIERRNVQPPPSPAMARAIAAHKVLSEIVLDYEAFFRAHGVPAVPSDLVNRIERALSHDPYPDTASWASDVNALVMEVKRGVSYLDGEARVLATEITFQYPYGGDAECPPFVLAAKVDALLHRLDAVGRPYLDIVDWKGGTGTKRDSIQELACRIVVQHNAGKRFGLEPAFIQNSTVHLGVAAHRSVVIEREEGRQRWSELKQLAAGIMLGGDWLPNPSPLCEWCPFFGNGCSLGVQTSQPDTLTNWLDPIAV